MKTKDLVVPGLLVLGLWLWGKKGVAAPGPQTPAPPPSGAITAAPASAPVPDAAPSETEASILAAQALAAAAAGLPPISAFGGTLDEPIAPPPQVGPIYPSPEGWRWSVWTGTAATGYRHSGGRLLTSAEATYMASVNPTIDWGFRPRG